MPDQVFISYAHQDGESARRVAEVLEERGVSTWMAPDDIAPGQDYAAAIVEAIRASKVFLLLISGHSNESVHVRNEVERAVSGGLDVIPVRLEDVTLSSSLEYFVSSRQWVDATGAGADRAFRRLAKRLDPRSKREAGRPARTRSRRAASGAGGMRWWVLGLLVAGAIGIGGHFAGWWSSGDDDARRTDRARVPERPEHPEPDVPEPGGRATDTADVPDEDETPVAPRALALRVVSPPEGSFSRTRQIAVEGTWEGAPGDRPERVTANGTPCLVREHVFEGTVLADANGPFVIEVAGSGTGLEVQSARRDVVVDQDAPTMRIEVEGAPDGVVRTPAPTITVHVDDPNLAWVEVNGRRTNAEEPSVTLPVDLRLEPGESGTVTVAAGDRAGNRVGPREKRVRFEQVAVALEVESPSEGALLGARTFDVRGRVGGVDRAVRIRVGDVETETDEQGGFHVPVRQGTDGPAEIRIDVLDPGCTCAGVLRRVRVDTQSPVLELARAQAEVGTGLRVYEAAGRVTDDSIVSLTINDEDVPLREDGGFRWPVLVHPGTSVRLVFALRDEAGNDAPPFAQVVQYRADLAPAHRPMEFLDDFASGFRVVRRTGQTIFVCVSRYVPP